MRLCGAALRDKRMAWMGILNRPAFAIEQMLKDKQAGHAKGSRQRHRHLSRVVPHAQQRHKAHHENRRVDAMHQAAVAGCDGLAGGGPDAASAQQRREQAGQPAQAVRGDFG